MTTSRAVLWRFPARRTLEGEGFEVMRAIPTSGLPAVGPFIFLDHFGPVTYAPEQALGAPDHPHAGLETLTVLLDGEIEHRDSLGNRSVLRAGEAQWMRAGRGVVHSEMPSPAFRAAGGIMHEIQLWLDMPPERRHAEPTFRHVGRDAIPTAADGRNSLRVIAGRHEIGAGPIETFCRVVLFHITLAAGGSMRIPVAADDELGVYPLSGAASCGPEATPISAGTLAMLESGDVVDLSASADEPKTELLLLGGESLRAPILRYGPFVMNTHAQLRQAIEDYQGGRMGAIPHERWLDRAS